MRGERRTESSEGRRSVGKCSESVQSHCDSAAVG